MILTNLYRKLCCLHLNYFANEVYGFKLSQNNITNPMFIVLKTLVTNKTQQQEE